MEGGKVDYDAMIVEALQEIGDALNRIGAILEKQQGRRTGTVKSAKREKTKEGKRKKLTAAQVLKKIENYDEDVYELVKQVKTFPSGDLLVTFEKLDEEQYKRFKEVMQELFNAKYYSKYKGFIIKQGE